MSLRHNRLARNRALRNAAVKPGPAQRHRIATVTQRGSLRRVRPGAAIYFDVWTKQEYFDGVRSRNKEISMKQVFVAFVIVLLGGMIATGQAVSQPQGSSGVAGMENMQTTETSANNPDAQPAPVSSCPVSMRAQHLSDGGIVKTRVDHPSGIGQWLHLSLIGRDSRQIARATLRVRGFSPKGRVTQTGPGVDPAFDAMQTLTVSFASGTDRIATADFRVAGMTAVGRIDLESLEYNDGSTWKIGDASSCRVAPDPKMLVTSR
jgi:hypothetical protein